MKTVYIAYGFSEGPKHGKEFKKALLNAGFNITKNLNTANIVVAHSGGAYLVEPSNTVDLMIVDPAYWDEKKLGHSFMQNLGQKYKLFTKELTHWSLFNKMLWHMVYILTKPLTIYRMWDGWQKRNDWFNKVNKLNNKTTVIRNTNDPFCSAAIKNILNSKITFIELPGYHDDIWLNPKPYVELLS